MTRDARAGGHGRNEVSIYMSALQNEPGLLPRLEAFTEITGIRVELIQDGPDFPDLSAGQVDRPDVTFENGRTVAVADRPEVRLLLEHLANSYSC